MALDSKSALLFAAVTLCFRWGCDHVEAHGEAAPLGAGGAFLAARGRKLHLG